ncbi:hypothetical protein [Niveibacterium terrae]|uniref:hypothetical protein n=1 Tax=Niveibacterium terrae TaxID=3373598 RepID=UPI003A919147
MYQQLGAPRFHQIFSRYPGHWRIQLRFIRFLLSGRVAAKTNGWPRVAALICMVGFATALISIVFLITAAINAPNP